MPHSSLPSVAAFAQRLAQDNRRVGRTLDQLPTLVHEIIAAWDRGDQRSLRQLAARLVAVSAGQPPLASLAGQLAREIQARNMRPAQRTLLALVGEAGALRGRGMVPAVALPACRGATS